MFKSDRVSGFILWCDEFFYRLNWCVIILSIYANQICHRMKRSSTSSNVYESSEKQPAAKRSWGLGSLLHGLAGYVRPKNNVKDKSSRNVAERESETLSMASDDSKVITFTRLGINERVPIHGAGPMIGDHMRNETSVHAPKYESTLSRSSTFNYAPSRVHLDDQQQRTPILPRFRRNR